MNGFSRWSYASVPKIWTEFLIPRSPISPKFMLVPIYRIRIIKNFCTSVGVSQLWWIGIRWIEFDESELLFRGIGISVKLVFKLDSFGKEFDIFQFSFSRSLSLSHSHTLSQTCKPDLILFLTSSIYCFVCHSYFHSHTHIELCLIFFPIPLKLSLILF